MSRLACAVVFWVLAGCSTSLDLGYNDAGVQYDADCKSGTYAGGYACTQTSTSALQILGGMGDGSISFTLVPTGAHTLALAPDAGLSAMIMGATETTGLSGILDCSTRKLTGSAGDIAFTSPGFSGTLTGSGQFTAVYDADANPPELVNGVLNSPPSLGATCTWFAKLE